MSAIVALRDSLAPDTVLLGNGDVQDRLVAEAQVDQFGGDGVMIGRGIFHNPWAFAREPRDHTVGERLALLSRHLDIFEATWQQAEKRYEPLKKFFKIYIQGFDGAAHLRAELMATKTIEQARTIIDKYTPDE